MPNQRNPQQPSDDLAELPASRLDDAPVMGANVRAARVEAGMSQTALAEAMVAAGCKGWRQTTVSRTERGDRALKVREMKALGEVLPGAPILRGTSLSSAMSDFTVTVMPSAIEAQLATVNREVERLNKMWSVYSKAMKKERTDG
jgi:transcriptional regulator with XRE-family HTH domain